jgi:hypothetical protein
MVAWPTTRRCAATAFSSGATIRVASTETAVRPGCSRVAGAPACVYVNGTEKWYRNGLRHRDGGPAAIYPDGRRIWFDDGRKVKEERARG